MSRLSKGIIFGFLIGIIGLVINQMPLCLKFEEDVGLSLLFKIRGETAPPPDVVIITMDEEAAQHYNLPTNPEKWPRTLHAELLRKLIADKASVVAFDLFFKEPRSLEEDTEFSEAIRDARKVVLTEYIEKKTSHPKRPAGVDTAVYDTERRVPPIDLIKNAAAALAPFPLPKVPTKLCKYWTFKESIGNVPTIPVVTLQLMALEAYPELLNLFKDMSPKLAENLPETKERVIADRKIEKLIRKLRNISLKEPDVVEGMLKRVDNYEMYGIGAKKRTLLKSVLKMYQGANSYYLNFYGPPGTIQTVHYHRAFDIDKKNKDSTPSVSFENKVVFVGLSERYRIDQKDGYYTVFSQENGVNISGVEIAATAFANLLSDKPIRPLTRPLHLSFLMIWGLILGIVCYSLSTLYSGFVSVCLGLLYLGLAQYRFNQIAVWYPVVLPLFLQAPAAFFGAGLWKYREALKERRNIQSTIRKFLPSSYIGQLDRNMWVIEEHNQVINGVCLITDAYQYTNLAESMSPLHLGDFMSRYFKTLLEPVINHGGIVTDLKGDSIVAIWKIEQSDHETRRKACMAALHIDRNMRRFTQSSNGQGLQTRVGLHMGNMQLRPIGALEYYAYRALGDTVNTASRMEGLNKFLDTRLLVSEDVLEPLNDIHARCLGEFLFKGKANPIKVWELLGEKDDIEQSIIDLGITFQSALELYNKRLFKQAKERFGECFNFRLHDGPSRFYIKLCDEYEKNPPVRNWDRIVRLENK